MNSNPIKIHVVRSMRFTSRLFRNTTFLVSAASLGALSPSVTWAAADAAAKITAAAPVTNADIEKLLAAGMDDSVIVNVISAGEAHFDSSPDALIALKQKGASQEVLAAITGNGTRKFLPPQPAAAQPAATGIAPAAWVGANEVYWMNGDKLVPLYQSPTEGRIGGMLASPIPGTGVIRYSVLQGPAAHQRITSTNPVFRVSIARNIRADQTVALTRWAVRKNGNREIKVSHRRGFSLNSQSYSTMPIYPDERVMPLEFSEIKDGENVVARQVEVHVKKPLDKGEYALVISGHATFDFGVD